LGEAGVKFKMKSFIRMGLALAGLVVMPAFSQVQLFEQDLSGLVPYLGIKWNQSVAEAQAGLEYSIEGRTTLGFAYTSPLSDTIKWDGSYYQGDKPRTDVINPYMVFEFIEPGNLSTFSFAFRADMLYETLIKDEKNHNNFHRLYIGGGPIFAIRSWTSDRLALIPTASYEFFYVEWKKDLLLSPSSGKPTKGKGIAHDFIASCPVYYKFNEFHGMVVEPKGVFKLGETRGTKDLINLQLQVGYVWTM
jgi:hypothetical protein